MTNWLEDLHTELQSTELADSVEGAEQLIAQFNQQRETTVEAAINTVGEGETLLEQLRYWTWNCEFLHHTVWIFYFSMLDMPFTKMVDQTQPDRLRPVGTTGMEREIDGNL